MEQKNQSRARRSSVATFSEKMHQARRPNKLSTVFAYFDLSQKLKYFDFFGEKFSMKLDKENSTLKTTAGSLITIIVYIVIFMYAYI